ncbi:MAG: choice-of-anchor L domain-containing protein, partial [Bacteroidales bacterium]|nr:choice-of-anchor L domain-containing protein [Bacteroidales bacterium]
MLFFAQRTTVYTFRLIIAVVIVFISQLSFGQLVIDKSLTPEQLVQQVLIGSGVTVSNVIYTGKADSALGQFMNGNTTNLGIDEGIVLSSGDVDLIPGPANGPNASVNNGEPGDEDLDELEGVLGTNDASTLEFDFIPQSDTLTFSYVFGSEEYPEFVNQFNDVFAFFITGHNPNGPDYVNENIALIPGTNLPVTINNINNGPANNGPCTNCEYYINNSNGLTIVYDGFTTVLTATAVLTPCSTYHMKLSVADDLDFAYDSGVFLEANSFSAQGLNITQNFTQSGDNYGNTIEGCNDQIIHFELYEALPNDYVIGLTYGGTATPGVDYPAQPDSIVIPAGSTIDSIIIAPYQDNTIEPTESIIIGLDYESACQTENDTIYTQILDNSIAFSGLDTLYCTDDDPDTLSFYPPDAKISGPGMVDSVFYPDQADIGLNQVFCTKYFIDTTSIPYDTVCTNQLMLETTVGQAVYAFAGSDTSMCQGDPLDFSGLEQLPDTADCDSLLWIGGAGTFSDRRELHPIYFSTPDDLGALQLGIVAYGVPPCGNDTSYMTLQVDSIPDGYFNAVPIDTCCTNSIIQFTGNSTCIITQWEWDFGDGSPLAYGQVVTHQYDNPGDYTVTMTLYNQYGCTGSQSTVKVVEDVDEEIITDTIACLDETHFFEGTGDITFTDYEWDFGDGDTASGRNVTHVYTSPGSYTVRLVVCSDTNFTTVQVSPMPLASFLSSEQDTTCTDNEIDFTGIEITGTVDSWQWDFGDGQTDTGQIVSHTYTTQGDYTISLYYGNADACYDTVQENLRIEEVDIGFNRSPNPSCHGTPIVFQGIDFNNNTDFTQWTWDFGDGSPPAFGQNTA